MAIVKRKKKKPVFAKPMRANSKQTKWDMRYLSLALNISDWSKDPSTKCGAVIVKDNQILGTGYNGFARGVEDAVERLEARETKYSLVIHAELNAILNAQGRLLTDSTIYVTHPPCSNCISLLAQVGISRAVYSRSLDTRFNKSWNVELTKQVAKETNIELVEI